MQWENFLLQSLLCVLTLTRCPFHPRVTAVARKRPQSFCQKCRWQVTPVNAYTLDPTKSEWADYAAVQAYCGNLSGNELTRNLSGNTRPQSSQLAEPLLTDPGLKTGISVRELNPYFKKKKKSAGGEWMVEHSPKNPRKRGKSHHQYVGEYLSVCLSRFFEVFTASQPKISPRKVF